MAHLSHGGKAIAARRGARHARAGGRMRCVAGTAHVVASVAHCSTSCDTLQLATAGCNTTHSAARCNAARHVATPPLGYARAVSHAPPTPALHTCTRALPGACVYTHARTARCARAWEVSSSGAVRRCVSMELPVACCATQHQHVVLQRNVAQCNAVQPLHAPCSGCSAHTELRGFVVGVDAARLFIGCRSACVVTILGNGKARRAKAGRTVPADRYRSSHCGSR